jgi:hypothetical protein
VEQDTTPPPSPNTSGSDFENLKATLIKEVKTLMATGKRPPNHYCWTHGVGNHDSKSCKFPKLGHVATASAKSKSGGSDHVYKKRKN